MMAFEKKARHFTLTSPTSNVVCCIRVVVALTWMFEFSSPMCLCCCCCLPCVCMYVFMYMRMCMYVYVYLCMYMCMCMCMCMCDCVYVYVYVCVCADDAARCLAMLYSKTQRHSEARPLAEQGLKQPCQPS